MTNAKKPITLLHLSDTQFGKHHTFGIEHDNPYDTLLERLKEDLKKLNRNHQLQPDCVVITGDLVEWGRRSEFEQISKFLQGLCDALQLKRDHVIMIPGNHDINRAKCDAYFSECEADEREPRPPYWPKWAHYREFFIDFYTDTDHQFTEDFPWTLFKLPELKIVIAGLNSTMQESHREVDHYGRVGEEQCRWFAEQMETYLDQGWLRIGAIHHNIVRGQARDDENLRDAQVLEHVLSPKLNLILHGHTHKGQMGWLNSTTPILSTGSAALKSQARPEEIPNQYQMIQISPTKIKTWGRIYLPGSQQWTGDNRVDVNHDAWWLEQPVLFDRITGTFSNTESATITHSNQGEHSPLVDSLLNTIQQHPITALLIQDYVQTNTVYQDIEKCIEGHFGAECYWRLNLYSQDDRSDTYFQHLAKQLDKNHSITHAAEFENLLCDKITQHANQPCCLFLTGFEAGSDEGRELLAGILRSLVEQYPLHVMISGGKYLAETIDGAGDLSLLNMAQMIRYPELTVDQVIAHNQALFPADRPEMDKATARSLLNISGGHLVLLQESLKFWRQQGDVEACKAALAGSPFISQIFLPFTKDSVHREQVYHWLQQTTLPAHYPYIPDPLLNDLYWKNFLTYQEVEGKCCLIWRGDVLRQAGCAIFSKIIEEKPHRNSPKREHHYIDSIDIQDFFTIKNVSLKGLKDIKEIYIVGENGDGKTIFSQALVLALKGDPDYGLLNDHIKSEKKYMVLSASDGEKSFSFDNKAQKKYQYLYAYGVHRHRADFEKKESLGYFTLFNRDQYLNNPDQWLTHLDYKESKNEKDALPLDLAKSILLTLLSPNIEAIEVSTSGVTYLDQGRPTSLDHLSEGYRGTIIWICDLLQRLSEDQPNVNALADFVGTVLIDEIDLHLHPHWEYRMVRMLRHSLPNIQFILTTHSPVVIRGASEDAVFYKLYKEKDKTKLTQPLTSVKNMMANTVVTSPLFSAETARAHYHDDDVDTSDDYLYSVIHKQIAERLKNNKGISEEDILEEVLAELDAYENDQS